MPLLEINSIEKAGKGFIKTSQGLSMAIQVVKPSGRLCFIVKADNIANGLSANTAGDAWQLVVEFYGITKIKKPVVTKRLKNRLLSRKL